MNTRIFKIALVFLITITLSCNTNEATLPDFKYADQPNAVDCKTGYDDVLKEALYSFESDIVNKYDPKNQNKLRAYRGYINYYISNRMDLENTISAHSKAIYDVLKTKTDLWDGNHLNYNGQTIECISQNIKDQSLKKTLNALISTNSMSSELFAAPLRSNTSYSRDTNLATFIALDLYFSKFNTVDFTKVDFQANQPKQQEPANLTKTPKTPVLKQKPAKKEIDHTGHDHN